MQRDGEAIKALFAQTADVVSELRDLVRTSQILRAQARELRQDLQEAAGALPRLRPPRPQA
jgi:hypothetical protein